MSLCLFMREKKSCVRGWPGGWQDGKIGVGFFFLLILYVLEGKSGVRDPGDNYSNIFLSEHLQPGLHRNLISAV